MVARCDPGRGQGAALPGRGVEEVWTEPFALLIAPLAHASRCAERPATVFPQTTAARHRSPVVFVTFLESRIS